MRQDVESFNDFLQYYAGHYVKGRQPEQIFRIVVAHTATSAIIEEFQGGKRIKSEVMTWDMIKNCILFGVPRLGMVTLNNELLFLYYKAARAGGRGYDPARINFTAFNSWTLARTGQQTFTRASLSEGGVASRAMFSEHTPWDVAVKDVLAPKINRPAYALSYNFGVYLQGEYLNPILCYKTTAIGEILDVRTVRLTTTARIYGDLIRRTLGERINTI